MRTSSLALAALSFVPTAALAQQSPPSPVQRDPQAITLLDRCASAMGAVGQTDAIYATGQITYADGQSPAEDLVLKSIGSDRVRREGTKPSGQSVFILNSGIGRGQRGGSSAGSRRV